MKLTDKICVNGNYYIVDSCYTFDHGLETMVFPCDENGKITSWSEVYANWYATENEMYIHHEEIIAHPERYIE